MRLEGSNCVSLVLLEDYEMIFKLFLNSQKMKILGVSGENF